MYHSNYSNQHFVTVHAHSGPYRTRIAADTELFQSLRDASPSLGLGALGL